MRSLFLVLAAYFLCFSHQVKASNIYTPYIGIDGIYGKMNAKGFNPFYLGAKATIGTTYNSYFGTELFFEQVGSDSKKIDIHHKYTSSYRAYGLDLIGYLPFGQNKTFQMLASAGIGEYVFKEKLSGQKHHNNSAYGYRLGGGALYHLNNNLALKAMVYYTNFDHISHMDHMLSYTLGLRYFFTKE